ncbi:MAG TPA: DUF3987 domain-containing protein [Oligoflexus sp.]|uniref:DUF3987 domain-containing protein n=1 Tax=Oligoflexus sp. TaxID=1971216 RepID=UPI002D3A3B2D|nr:DUF3987 domain-containing protein [Oligoflexus sp.]HYX39667.1 DUF3987 domain-containing protein [Oligoflexus sp.]
MKSKSGGTVQIPKETIELIKQRLPPLKVAKLLGLESRNNMILCPYHEDTVPSMSCGHDFIFNCFACNARRDVLGFYAEQRQCTFPEAIEALASHAGIDIPAKPAGKPKRRSGGPVIWSSLEAARVHFNAYPLHFLDCEHTWHNRDGSMNRQVFRMRPKDPNDPRQRKLPMPAYRVTDDRWISARPEGHPQPLPYRWLEIGVDEVILLLEGETDVDAAMLHEFSATTTGSATSWQAQYTEFFVNRDVVVVPDNDQSGRDYLRAVIAALRPVCRSLRSVKLEGPKKFDLRDFFTAGGTRAQLQAMIAEAPDLRLSWSVPRAGWDAFERIPHFDADIMLPESLRYHLEYVAADMQCPLDAVAAATIAALSSVIGAKLGLKPKQNSEWVEWPNLWYLLVAPAGDKKTAIIRAALRMVHTLDAELQDANREAAGRRQADLFILGEDRQQLESTIRDVRRKGGDMECLREQLASINARIGELEGVGDRCLILQDVTPERAKALLIANPNGLLQFCDEFGGWWRTLDKGTHSDARSMYLECWGGGHIKVQRVKGSISGWSILSFVSATQPDWLKSVVKKVTGGTEENDGMLARFGLMINHDRSIDLFRWHDLPANPAAREIFELLFRTMWELKREDITGDPERKLLRFSPEAQDFFAKWLVEHENRHRDSKDNPALTSHLAKQSRLFCSLALIFHLVLLFDGEVINSKKYEVLSEVSIHAVRLAADWCRYIALHVRKTYDPKNGYWDPSVRSFAALVRGGKIRDGMSRSDVLAQRHQHLKTAKELDRALSELSGLHLVQELEDQPVDRQRPRRLIRLNPMPYSANVMEEQTG